MVKKLPQVKEGIVAFAVCSILMNAWTPVLAAGTGTTPSAQFAALSDEFIMQSLILSPTSASQAGYHKYVEKESGRTIELDSKLDDMSRQSMESQRRFFANWRDRFHKETPLASLTPEDAADWQLIDDQIGQQLLELDDIHNYEHNPTVAVELIGTALFQPLTEDYAPMQTRLEHIISRIEQIPHLLNDVKAYLKDADPLYIKTAVEENDGNIDLIENTIAKEISASDKNGELKARFNKISPVAIAALKGYSNWLQDTLSKQPQSATGDLAKTVRQEIQIGPASRLDSRASIERRRARPQSGPRRDAIDSRTDAQEALSGTQCLSGQNRHRARESDHHRGTIKDRRRPLQTRSIASHHRNGSRADKAICP